MNDVVSGFEFQQRVGENRYKNIDLRFEEKNCVEDMHDRLRIVVLLLWYSNINFKEESQTMFLIQVKDCENLVLSEFY